MKKGTPPRIPGLVYVQPLGSGGYADVFLYEQQSPRMPVAVKVLKSDGLTKALTAQFVEEANTMAELGDHPYIVQIFRTGTSEDGRPFLVMKYYPPPNLAIRSRAERFTVEETLRTGIQLASAVETAHRAGIIHRDIKPANVLVSPYGAPGLTDFGIAGRGTTAEDTDEVGVSVPWAAPEVLYGMSNGDGRSDIYSLAATLWQLLAGRSPFEIPGGDNSAYALMPRVRAAPVPPVQRQDVPVSLERLLAQAMAKDANHRPMTALEFARALQAVEQELQLPRTPIVVLDESGHTTLISQTGPNPDDEDKTRIKAPQTVQAQERMVSDSVRDSTRRAQEAARWSPVPGGPAANAQGAAPGFAPGGPASAPLTQSGRPSIGSPMDSLGALGGGLSYHRPGGQLSSNAPSLGPVGVQGGAGSGIPAAPAPIEQDEPDGGGGRSPAALVATALIFVLALGGITFFAVKSRGGSDPVATPTAGMTTTSAAGPDVLTGIPQLKAASVKGGVTFVWSYADPIPEDKFQLQVAFGKNQTVADAKPRFPPTTTLMVPAKAGTQVCARVAIIRSNQISPYSTDSCEVAQ